MRSWLLLLAILDAPLVLAAVSRTASAVQLPTYITQWGSRGSGNGQFIWPGGAATDAAGNLYVMDAYVPDGNTRLQKFDNNGTYLTQWTVNGDYVATDRTGSVYVSSTNYHFLRKFTGNGAQLSFGYQGYCHGELRYPRGIATDADFVYVATGVPCYYLMKYRHDGTYVGLWGSYGSGDTQFSSPAGVAIDGSGHLYVADGYSIKKFDRWGTFLAKWGGLDGAGAVAIGTEGEIYVADTRRHRVVIFDGNGTNLGSWGTYGTGIGQFGSISGIATDSQGNIFVVDSDNSRIQKFGPAPTPALKTSWGRIKTIYR